MTVLRYCALAIMAASCGPEYGFEVPLPEERPPSHPAELDPEYQSDDWVPPQYQAHDLLLVVDDSCSMADDMLRLSANVENLAGPLLASGMDARIVVATTSCGTDGSCEPLVVIDDGPTMAADLRLVMEGVDIGHGNNLEQGLLSLDNAITPPLQSWARRVPLDVVFITDEGDASPESYLPPGALEADLLEEAEWRRGLPGRNDWVRVSAIVPAPYGDTDPTDICRDVDTNDYESLARAWGGQVADLCVESWASVVDLVLPTDETIIWLSRQPVVDTIELHVDQIGVDVVMDPSAWAYNEVSNSVSILIGRPNRAWVEYEVAE